MKELNQAVYYTTAQVTELVELSDQNVRKYVRLLEDRKYEVAKDEHNRRLFSANDVLILRELIKKAKQPGYTLESAADDIVNEISEIISWSSHKMTPNNNNNDIREMFSLVIDRLDEIQEENRDLKNNIRHLVERLEHYDQYDAQRYIGYDQKGDYNGVEVGVTGQEQAASFSESEESGASGNDAENNALNDHSDETNNGGENDADMAQRTTEVDSIDKSEDEKESAPSVSENPDRKNIDMNAYSDNNENEGNTDKEISSDNDADSHENEQEKGGFLDSLFKMFRK